MKADMADKEMLESSQSKYEEEVREKCSIISEQKAVSSDRPGIHSILRIILTLIILTQISHLENNNKKKSKNEPQSKWSQMQLL